MNLSQLYYFRKLAEIEHYGKASKELFITQPSLSNAIGNLERELGVQLNAYGACATANWTSPFAAGCPTSPTWYSRPC